MGWTDGHWLRPYVTEQQAIEHAVQMADRWHRMFRAFALNLCPVICDEEVVGASLELRPYAYIHEDNQKY